jgi:hypothetical protein
MITVGAENLETIIKQYKKKQRPILGPVFFQFDLIKLIILLKFIDKKNSRKFVNFYGFVVQLKQAIVRQRNFFYYYLNNYLKLFLVLLRIYKLIFNFFMVPKKVFYKFLVYSKSNIFLDRIVLVYLKHSAAYGFGFKKIFILSKRPFPLFVTFRKLLILVKKESQVLLFCLNTTRGLIMHDKALFLKIGGFLVCSFQ